LTKGAVFGQTKYLGLQEGPTSPGREWLVRVVNVNVTPYSVAEPFAGDSSVLSKDNLKVEFQVHVIWKVRKADVKEFVEKFTTLNDSEGETPLLKSAYNDFLKEPVRTFSRSEVQKYNGLDIKDQIDKISNDIFLRVKGYTNGTPFDVTSVVVGNIQYPKQVADSVALKMSATQDLERKQTEIEIEKKEATKRVVQAEGIARAMDIINKKLTSNYLQHEAIEAQRLMANSPNHTTVYIPVGNMGVPVVGTVNIEGGGSVSRK
jgi:regulator of protease activity HflC (stomatin/prohibitin superfamily)